MAKNSKIVIAVPAILSIVVFLIAVFSDNFKGCEGWVVWPMLVSLLFGVVISQIDFALLMCKRVDKKAKDTQCQCNPEHQVWPLWLFLVSVLIVIGLMTLIVYLAFNMWGIRDLANFELTAVLSMIIVHWFNYRLFKK